MNTQRSKYLSLLLRHSPERAFLDMDKNGWVSVNQLTLNTDFTFDELIEIVGSCEKQRYEFNKDKTKIRARQGHSIKSIDLNYKPQVPPAFLYHGTSEKFFYPIWSKGLMKKNRHHVHLSSDQETAKKVGQRHGKPVILTVCAQEMHEKGYKFYKTENNVWLTENVPTNFIKVQGRVLG